MNELFPTETVQKESPRLEWLKANSICTFKAARWVCWTGENSTEGMRIEGLKAKLGFGETEDDAITDWSKRNSIPLWNEQQFVREKRNL